MQLERVLCICTGAKLRNGNPAQAVNAHKLRCNKRSHLASWAHRWTIKVAVDVILNFTQATYRGLRVHLHDKYWDPCSSSGFVHVAFRLLFLISHHQVEQNNLQSKFSNLVQDNCQHLHTPWKPSPACYHTGTSSNHTNPPVSRVNKTSRSVIIYSQPKAVR